MTNIAITKGNFQEIFQAGRLRWKIENEGFNTQKNGGYAFHHKMNRTNINAIQKYYICLQIAHLFSQLLELRKNSHSQSYDTKKKMWEYLLSIIRTAEDLIFKLPLKKINLRY